MSGGVLARRRPDLGIGALAPPGGNVRGGGSPGAWHTHAALGDNAGMARDDGMAYLRWAALRFLDGGRPARTSGWVPLVTPVVTQAAAGAGHWADGRRQRALAEWAGAAGFGLIAWGLGTEAPTAAEVQESFRRQLDLMRKPGTPAPASPRTETPAARRIDRFI